MVLSRSTFIATLARMALAGEVAGLALRGLHHWRQRVHQRRQMAGQGGVVLDRFDGGIDGRRRSWPSTMRSGTFSTATPYSKLAMVSSSAKLPAWRQTNTSPRGLEAEFRCDARVGAAQHRGKRILALGERFALVPAG